MYRKILVVTFGTELSNKAVKEAAQLAKALGAKLLVLHVRSPLDIPHHAEGGALSRFGEEKITEEIVKAERELLDGAVKAQAHEPSEVSLAEGRIAPLRIRDVIHGISLPPKSTKRVALHRSLGQQHRFLDEIGRVRRVDHGCR